MVFWAVMPCDNVVEYQCFGRACCLHLHPKLETSKPQFSPISWAFNFFFVVIHLELKLLKISTLYSSVITFDKGGLVYCKNYFTHLLQIWHLEFPWSYHSLYCLLGTASYQQMCWRNLHLLQGQRQLSAPRSH